MCIRFIINSLLHNPQKNLKSKYDHSVFLQKNLRFYRSYVISQCLSVVALELGDQVCLFLKLMLFSL